MPIVYSKNVGWACKEKKIVREKLIILYGEARGNACYKRLMTLLDTFRADHPELAQRSAPPGGVSEQDVMLITYGDTLLASDAAPEAPLQTLHRFLRAYLGDVLSAVHILPFFPYTSDYGFSIVDYKAVNPDLGSWADVRALGTTFDLMFDAVINHISVQSAWFQGFLSSDPRYQDYFIAVDPTTDLSQVVRPRALPLLTEFATAGGPKHVWTTFSADQVDLNYASENVLLDVIDVLLFYVSQGMTFLRLDAIAFLWKEIGTNCLHLTETHLIVQLIREVFDAVAPYVTIITETNVPHEENVSYFGDGTNEAQLVYQFPLPPLTLHAIATGNATILSQWAASLETPSEQTTFFNFTASHDGIGLRPTEGILREADVAMLVERTKAHGGEALVRTLPDGSTRPYELNINYFDALSDPAADEPIARQVQRFMVSQAIQLALVGMPGIYVHSLLGSRSWRAGIDLWGELRAINREQLPVAALAAEFADPDSRRSQVLAAYRHLITIRRREKAFHPNGEQQVLDLDPVVFALLRTALAGDEQIVALHNVADAPVTVDLQRIPLDSVTTYTDLITATPVQADAKLELQPYQILWLKA
ncbi:MAG: sugar phosphorylase [Anaerolineae bacterium]|nr:sugar phosphorylase [Anaerolineae bacterium]